MQCDSVCATDGMPVAAVAGGFPAVAGGLHDVLALAQLRLVGTGHARTASTRACESGAQARSDPCNHRQPVSQDSAKGGQRGYDGGKKTKGRKRHLFENIDTGDVIADMLAELVRALEVFYCCGRPQDADEFCK
jgi:hypothetical protein